MAKVQTPLYSFGAHGSIGDSLTFAKTSRIQIAKSFSVPANPNSPAQLAHRDNIAYSIAAFHAMQFNLADIAAFLLGSSVLGRAMSGYNYFMLRCLSVLRRGFEPGLCTQFLVDYNSGGSIFFSVEYYGVGSCYFQYGDSPHNLGGLVEMEPPAEGWVWVGEIGGLTPGKDIYIRFTDSLVSPFIVSGIYKVRVLQEIGPVLIPLTIIDWYHGAHGGISYLYTNVVPFVEISTLVSFGGGPFQAFEVNLWDPVSGQLMNQSGGEGAYPWVIRYTPVPLGYECFPPENTFLSGT